MELPEPPPDGNNNLVPGLIASATILVAVTIITVALRVATRGWIVKAIGWDDVTIVLALVVSNMLADSVDLMTQQLGATVGAELDLVIFRYGSGRPAWYLTDYQLQQFFKHPYSRWILTFAGLMWTKISICLFLMHITASKAYIRSLQAGFVILVAFNAILTSLWISQCSPVQAAWIFRLRKQSKCFSKGQLQRIIISQAGEYTPFGEVKIGTFC